MSQVDAHGHGDELSLADVVRFFRRNWGIILGCAFVAGLVTALVLLASVKRSYEAAATLVIVPPKFSSELKPQTLTVQSYQKILESDAVIAGARKELAASGMIRPDQPLRLGTELESRIFVSRRAEETTLAPMLQAVARGATGEQAAAIANTWAAVFLARTRDLIAGTTSSTVEFIDQQYPQVRDTLTKLEDTRVTEADGLQRRYDEAATRWDNTITGFKNETTLLVAEYQAETRRFLEEFASQHNLDTRKAQLTALRKAYSDLQDEQARVTSQLQLKQLQLEAVRKQLADTPQLLTLQKAVTDDALWRSVTDAKGADPNWKALQQRSLATQEVNPVYTSLSAKVAEIGMDVNAMVPRAAGLTKDLERLSEEMKAREGNIRADEAAQEKLQRERESGLTQLQEDRANKLNSLQRQRQEELDALKRAMDTRLGQLDRDILQQRDLFAQLAKNYNQALLAKGEQGIEDVRLGAPAVAPQVPQPRGRLTKSLLAAILGGMLGIGVALVRESWA